MLVCAPTGAGKTNIATLAILHAIQEAGSHEDVKIVYISPNTLINRGYSTVTKVISHDK